MDTSIIEFVYSGSKKIIPEPTNIIPGSGVDSLTTSPATSDLNFILMILLSILSVAFIAIVATMIKSRIYAGAHSLHKDNKNTFRKYLIFLFIAVFSILICCGAMFNIQSRAFGDYWNDTDYEVPEKVTAYVGDNDIKWDKAQLTNNEDEDILFYGIYTNPLCYEVADINFTIKADDQLIFNGLAGEENYFCPIRIKPHESISLNYDSSITLKQAETLFNKYAFEAKFICDKVILDSIDITTPPTKTSYTLGEKFDKTGMKVTATLTNGDTFDVTDKVEIYPDVLNSVGNQEVYIKYEHKGLSAYATQIVNVSPKKLFTGDTMYFPVFEKPITGVTWYKDNEVVEVESMADIKEKGVNGYSTSDQNVTFTAVRAISESWNTAFGDKTVFPTKGRATKYIGPSIKDGEQCATLNFLKSENKEPSINGVGINLINECYELNPTGDFYSCECDNDIYAYDWYCDYDSWWTGSRENLKSTIYIVFSKEFN